MEPSTPQGSTSSQDPDRDRSSIIFSGFAVLLTFLLLITIFCVLWNCNKWKKKRQVPYVRVTVLPLLSLPRPRQRVKNIYDPLPRRQVELGRRPSRSVRIFSTTSLLSRSSHSSPSEYVASAADSVLQPLAAQAPALGHAVGICDRAAELQICVPLCPLAHNTSTRASSVCSSSSSEDSRDYVNIPMPEELAEALASTGPGSPLVLPSAQEPQLAEEGDQGCDHTGPWSLGAERSDPRSDGDSSSQSSDDYVNVAEVDLEVAQEQQPRVAVQQCRDYENVPPAGPHASQQQLEEGAPSNTDPAGGRMDAPDTLAQPVVPSGRSLAAGGHVSCQPPAQEEHSAGDLAEEVSDDGSNDYENVPPVPRFGDEDTKEGSDPQLLPQELASSHLPESHEEWSSEDS